MQKRAAMQKRLQAAKQSQKQWTPPPIRLPEAVIEKPKGQILSVKEIDRDTTARKNVTDAAGAIDSILESEWSEAGISAGEELTDEQFVRRVYLDLGGRIPRLDEVKSIS